MYYISQYHAVGDHVGTEQCGAWPNHAFTRTALPFLMLSERRKVMSFTRSIGALVAALEIGWSGGVSYRFPL